MSDRQKALWAAYVGGAAFGVATFAGLTSPTFPETVAWGCLAAYSIGSMVRSTLDDKERAK